jgi:hypothetical protein
MQALCVSSPSAFSSTYIPDSPHSLEDLLAYRVATPRLWVGDVHVEHVEHVGDELAEPSIDFLAGYPSVS